MPSHPFDETVRTYITHNEDAQAKLRHAMVNSALDRPADRMLTWCKTVSVINFWE